MEKIVFTNAGRQYVALGLGSDIGKFIAHVGIGTGSAAVLVSDSTLVTEANRTSITGSPDFSTSLKVQFQADFNSVQMSGLELQEFGLTDVASGTGFTGSMWAREGFGSVAFDGTNELQIITTIEVLPSGTS